MYPMYPMSPICILCMRSYVSYVLFCSSETSPCLLIFGGMRVGTLSRVAALSHDYGVTSATQRLWAAEMPRRRTRPPLRHGDGHHVPIAFRVPQRCACGHARRACPHMRTRTAGVVRAYVLARVAMAMARRLRCPTYEVMVLRKVFALPIAIRQDTTELFWRWMVRTANRQHQTIWWPFVQACIIQSGAPRMDVTPVLDALLHVLPLD